MRTGLPVALLAALLCTWPAAAQEQRGVIEGIVKDASGAVLPGATVEAQADTGAVVATTTDNLGGFRFPSLAPNIYVVTARLAGFTTVKASDVVVGLGQVKKLDFTLSVAGVQESVSVTAESPLVDVRQSARQTNIRREQIDLLPKGRDFTTLVTQAAGANDEGRLGGLSIDGASAAENRYIIDGIETTDLKEGVSGKSVIADFVEEVQVKSSGYTAEFGGATGGVINVVTKSGTNDPRGYALFNFQGSALSAGEDVCTVGGVGAFLGACAGGRPTLRSSLTDPANVAEYVNYPEDNVTRIEPGLAVGGPIVRNRAWYFGAYQPALVTTKRTVTATTAANPAAGAFNEDQKVQIQYVTGNLTTQMGDSLRGRVAYNNSWTRTSGLLPSLQGTDATGTDYGKVTTNPNWSLSANVDWTASSKMFFGLRGGYSMSDINDSNLTPQPRVLFATGNNLNFPEVPESLRHATGFQTTPNNTITTRDARTRLYFQGDGTLYANMAGSHQVKFGVQADRLGNDVLTGESGNLVRLRWNTQLVSNDPTSRGTYGYYQVRSNGVNPKQGLITEGNIHMNVLGLFVQDAWTISDRLSVNLGIRTERERVPTYTTAADIPKFGVEFDFQNKIAPRAGVAYDIKGDGRWKAFGSWGVFYDIFKLELPRGSFGGDKWLEYYYSLDTYDWTNLTASPNCPPACPGRILRGEPTPENPKGGVDFRHPSFGSDAIQPGLKPMRQQEATFGLDHQLNDVMALGVHYVHKQIDRAIEDTGSLDAQGNEIYIIANPGEGLAALAHPGVALPKPTRDYDSVEFAIEKRFANRWFFRSAYLWSRLYGNYSGLSQSDENGRTSPNVGRLYDYPMMMFKDGGRADLGPLATDRPHQFKTQFIYQMPFGTTLGVHQFVESGVPVTRSIGIYPPNTLPVQYLGRGSDGRTDMFSQTNLLVQHDFRLGARRLQVSLNVLNLFNQQAATSKFSIYQYSGGVIPDEDAFYAGRQALASLIGSQGVVKDPRFLMDNAFQAPIQARIGVKFLF
jgi:outer membrane receptor protein involved in Fe transport